VSSAGTRAHYGSRALLCVYQAEVISAVNGILQVGDDFLSRFVMDPEDPVSLKPFVCD
jgi:hypothetical protein